MVRVEGVCCVEFSRGTEVIPDTSITAGLGRRTNQKPQNTEASICSTTILNGFNHDLTQRRQGENADQRSKSPRQQRLHRIFPVRKNLRYSCRRLRWKYLRTSTTATTSSSKLLHHFGSMSSTTLFRFAARTQPSSVFRSLQPARRFSRPRGRYAGSSATATWNSFSTSVRRAVDKDGEGAAPGHHEETFEEFTARYADRPTGPTILSMRSETFGLGHL